MNPIIWCLNKSACALPGRHHVWEPNPAEVSGNLPVDLIQAVLVVRDEDLLHDGELCEAFSTHPYKLHEGAAGHFALSQADGWQLCTSLGDANQLLIQGTQAIGTHHQLHEPRAVHAHAAQHLLTDWAAEVEVCDGNLIPEKRLKLILIEEEIHDEVELGRVAHHGIPAAFFNGVKLLTWILAHNIDA